MIQKCTVIHKSPQNTNVLEASEDEEMDSEYEVEDVSFALMTIQNLRKDFIDEMMTKAVIDTTCTKTVAGEL